VTSIVPGAEDDPEGFGFINELLLWLINVHLIGFKALLRIV
jgi:hypothetical protein